MISRRIIGWIIGLSAGAIGLGATYYLRLLPDNPLEEMAEDIIKYETDYDVDLSPESKEKR